MGLAQLLRRFTANHSGATGCETEGLADVFAFCSKIGRSSCKLSSTLWEMMGN
jgi:hypothetical protein